ncbi:MAG: MarR family transcriptional regulator [Oscillospiraceae bacterium]|nr:MarR family transcriptional regulator [Oscillospiraceae bacterium]
MHEKKIGLELKSLMNTISRYVVRNRSAPPKGVTEMHAEIMTYLMRSEGRVVVQKDLEEAFTSRKSTISRMLRLMEQRGLIARVTAQEDARQKQIVLTEKSSTIRDKMCEGQNQFENTLRRGIAEEDLEIFFRVIDQIKSNISAGE